MKMNFLFHIITLAACCALFTFNVFAEDFVLENASSRFVMRDSKIISLYDKTRKIEHTTGTESVTSLLKIELVDGIKLLGSINAEDMKAIISKEKNGSIKYIFSHKDVSGIAYISLSADGNIEFSISASPASKKYSLAHIDFPVFETPNKTENEEKRFLLPYREGRLGPISKDLATEKGGKSFLTYPTSLFAQFIACIGKTGSFMLWTDDQKGYVREFGRDYSEKSSIFAVKHFDYYEAGRKWDISYKTIISFTGPEWQDVADLYRNWASKQPWSSVPVKNRKDIPEILKAPPISFSAEIGEEDDLSTVPGKLKAWKDLLNAPVIYRPLGWEKHGTWMGPDYFPSSIGDEKFKNLAFNLRKEGIMIAGFISGYKWKTVYPPKDAEKKNISAEELKKKNALMKKYYDENNGAELCELDRDGKTSVRICRGSEFGKSFLQNTASSMFDRGMSIIHDDVDLGCSGQVSEACFNKEHGHPIPCGTWQMDNSIAAFRAIRADAKKRGIKEFFLTKEYYSELCNQEIQGSQARFYPTGNNDESNVPLAQYIYHEYLISIFGWGSAPNINTLILNGQIPCFAFWSGSIMEPVKGSPEAVILRDYYDAIKVHSKDFLIFGKMQRPLIEPERLPHTVWTDTKGNVGVFAITTNTQKTSAEAVRILAPGEGKWTADFYLGSQKIKTEKISSGETLEWMVQPGRLCSVVFRK